MGRLLPDEGHELFNSLDFGQTRQGLLLEIIFIQCLCFFELWHIVKLHLVGVIMLCQHFPVRVGGFQLSQGPVILDCRLNCSNTDVFNSF